MASLSLRIVKRRRYQKGSSAKIVSVWKRDPFGTILISGAGTGAYLDDISARLIQGFRDAEKQGIEQLKSTLESIHRTYYSDCVIPCSMFPDHERPDYSLIIGCSLNYAWPTIWTTQNLACKKSEFFDAVGIGAPTAKALLNTLYTRIPVLSAINLAAYVMYHVKETVEGCGLGTDILYTWKSTPRFIKHEEIRSMEIMFREYQDVEREALHQCLASDLAEDFRHEGDISEKQSEMRKFFSELNAKRLSSLAPLSESESQSLKP
jgi:hypothetical protein